MSIQILTESGNSVNVNYGITEVFSNNPQMYGISAKSLGEDNISSDNYEVNNIFFTKEEAKAVISYLSKYEVCPCNMKDVLTDLLAV